MSILDVSYPTLGLAITGQVPQLESQGNMSLSMTAVTLFSTMARRWMKAKHMTAAR